MERKGSRVTTTTFRAARGEAKVEGRYEDRRRFRTRIDEAIRYHDKLLLVLSEHSVNSKWVEKEVETAFDKETPDHTVLFPIRLDDAVMKIDRAWAADIWRTRRIGDFSCWKDHDAYQKAFERLLRDLKAESAEASV